MNNRLLLTCLTLCLLHKVLAAPLETSTEKSEAEEAHPSTSKSVNLEEKVKEAVHKAELDASLAAQDAVKHGHKAETRVESIKQSSHSEGTGEDKSDLPVRKHANLVSDSDEGPHIKRVKEHKVNHKPGGLSKMMGLGELSDMGGNSNPYKEDTRLEDRLAMEAEEEKKYETGEGYGGGGGGGGGGAGWDSGKGANWATNIQRQDAAEKQSIQAQVASESAHELDEIQRAIAAESQSSRGSASIGNGGASVVGGAPGMTQQGLQSRISSQEAGRSMAFVGGQQKGINPSENQEEFQGYASPFASEQQSSLLQPEISSLIHQADKMMPSEMRGASQQSSMELGSLGARGNQVVSGGMGGLAGLEGAQQLGGQSQAAPLEQVPMGGSERAGLGGAMEAGGMGQEALGQAALGGGGSESAVSRMAEGSLGGGASLQGMQSVQGLQGMTSAFTGGQEAQGGMLSDGGAGGDVSALQGQSIMGGGGLQSSSLQGDSMQAGGLQAGGLQGAGLQGAGLQGGLQSMMGGGGLAGLQSMGGGAEFGQQQQMSFKKSTIARPSDFQRSKTHQMEETKSKHNGSKDNTTKSSLPRKPKAVPEKKSKMLRTQHSKHSKTL